MRYFIFLLLLSCLTTSLVAQSTTIDSLRKAIKIHKEAGNKIEQVETTVALSKAYKKEKDTENAVRILEGLTSQLDKQIPDTVKGKAILRFCISYISPISPVLDITTIS